MPGITGILSKHESEHSAQLAAMLKTMLYEPFFRSGTHFDYSLNAAVAWVAHPGSMSDSMPVWNETRDICLIFAGEDFQDKEVRARLLSAGHSFRPDDGSYLVHLYEELGAARFLERLNGIFCGLVLDHRTGSAILFNDRFGLGRLYTHETADALYFSSEAKALLKVLPQTREFDAASLGEFFACGCTLQNRSLYSRISVLPGGAVWTHRPGAGVSKQSYFSRATWEDQPVLEAETYYARLKETFTRVLPRYLNGSNPLGISLTGGVDSRMVMAWSGRAPGTLPCYTFGGRYRDSVDVKIARLVASICEQPHQVITVADDFLKQFPALAEKTVYASDGVMDVSGTADLFVNRVARQIAPVRMTGNYGGEILRRLVAFKPVHLASDVFQPAFQSRVEAARKTYAEELRGSRPSFVAFKQVPWHHYSRLALERSQIVMRSPYLDNELVALVYQAPPEIAESNLLALRLIADGNRELGQIGTDRGVLSRPTPLLTPLAHWYQEFTFKAEYAYDYGMPQWFAPFDSTLSGLHLERLFLGRHKFHHFRIWYRNELSAYIQEILLDSRTLARPYLQRRNLEKMVKDHCAGTRNYTLEIHRLLTMELAHRSLVEIPG